MSLPTSAITVEVIDDIKERVSQLLADYPRRLEGCRYADIRIEVSQNKVGVAQQGSPREGEEDAEFSFGIRIIAGEGMAAPGYFGQALGPGELPQLERIIKSGIDHAYRRARANAVRKLEAERRLGSLSNSLYSTALAQVEVCRDTVVFPAARDGLQISLEEILKRAVQASQAMASVDAAIGFNQVAIHTARIRQLFCSSEGTCIDQLFPLTQGFVYVVAREGEGGSESHYDCLGDLRGWEVMEGENVHGRSFHDFACDLARETAALCRAPVLDSTRHEVVVVTDPHYNALLVHEIIGHPTEADRALKMETGYAGRTWLFRGMDDHQIGCQVASELVSAYSDPALPGYGHFRYDAEGVKARRVMHIDRGIFCGFMNSRETAGILGQEPNGSMRATDAALVPLVRMTNTVFAQGETDPQRMIAEVDEGYYLVGHRIPSISESRENFRITARKVYRIEAGRLTTLYRNGGISADSKDYLMSIDAVGNDFKIYPIPNCGKGQPMQTMRVGNGGPTMRGRARLAGGEEA